MSNTSLRFNPYNNNLKYQKEDQNKNKNSK